MVELKFDFLENEIKNKNIKILVENTILKILENKEIKNIVLNAQMAIFFKEKMKNEKYNLLQSNLKELSRISIYNDCNVFLDPNLDFSDNKIIFSDNKYNELEKISIYDPYLLLI